ncbi:hypothetical protein C1645_765368 [Glomus cerebriforme]|uniref:Uncharacterized protein n=1 Tax=Glomus cerebriforme TaxID=658196 RepID=A0A397T7M1_9GLOM|nr:hypothetical protein C1645_765368 [Glomus cerebriforme]
MENPKKFSNRSKKNRKSNKHKDEVYFEKRETEKLLISSKSTTKNTNSIKINAQIQRPRNNNKIFQSKRKELSVTSRCDPGSEKQSDIKHKYPETDDKPASNNFNMLRIIDKIDKAVSETGTICKDLQATSKKDISASDIVGITKKHCIDANKITSNKAIIVHNNIISKGEKGENNHQRSRPCKSPLRIAPNQTITPIPRFSSIYPLDKNKYYHLTAPESARKVVVKHSTTANQIAFGEIINDDTLRNEILQMVHNSSKYTISESPFVLTDGYEKEAMFQLLRPEELSRWEFWHSYVNESRSPSFILCRFQVKKKRIYLSKYFFLNTNLLQTSRLKFKLSEKTTIKKVRFCKFVEVEKATDISEDRKGNRSPIARNKAINIWFTGTTGMNTKKNKKPERNPIAANIDWEDRTCDIHVYDPLLI